MSNHEYILIDSYKRTSGTSSDFIYELNKPIRDIKKIELVYSSFSNTILTFTENDHLYLQEDTKEFLPGTNNNFYFEEELISLNTGVFMNYTEDTYDTSKSLKGFKLIENLISSGEQTEYIIIIPYEEYIATVEQFIITIQTELNTVSPSKNYIVSYGLDGKITISNSDTDYKTFSLNFLPPPGQILSLYKEMGFGLVTTYDFSNSLTSDNVIDKSQIISKKERNVLLEAGNYSFNGFLSMLENKMNQNELRYEVVLFDGKIKIELKQDDPNSKSIFIIKLSDGSMSFLGFGSIIDSSHYTTSESSYYFLAPYNLPGTNRSCSIDNVLYDIESLARSLQAQMNIASDSTHFYEVTVEDNNKIKIYNETLKFKVKLLNNNYLRLNFAINPTFENTQISGSNTTSFENNIVKIQFQSGSYTSDEVLDFIKTQLNSNGRSGYDIVISQSTFKITISNSSKMFKLLFSYPDSVYRRLGYKNINTGYNTYHTSQYVANLESSDYLLIQIRNIATVITNKETSACFFIPVISTRYEVQTINENQSFNQSIQTHNLDLSDLHVKVLNDEGEVINSAELNLKILIKCYK